MVGLHHLLNFHYYVSHRLLVVGERFQGFREPPDEETESFLLKCLSSRNPGQCVTGQCVRDIRFLVFFFAYCFLILDSFC